MSDLVIRYEALDFVAPEAGDLPTQETSPAKTEPSTPPAPRNDSSPEPNPPAHLRGWVAPPLKTSARADASCFTPWGRWTPPPLRTTREDSFGVPAYVAAVPLLPSSSSSTKFLDDLQGQRPAEPAEPSGDMSDAARAASAAAGTVTAAPAPSRGWVAPPLACNREAALAKQEEDVFNLERDIAGLSRSIRLR